MQITLLAALAFCVGCLLVTIRVYERRTAQLQEELDYARAMARVTGGSR
jgi:hypothetical protein